MQIIIIIVIMYFLIYYYYYYIFCMSIKETKQKRNREITTLH